MSLPSEVEAFLASPERVLSAFCRLVIAALLIAGLLLRGPSGFAFAVLGSYFSLIYQNVLKV